MMKNEDKNKLIFIEENIKVIMQNQSLHSAKCLEWAMVKLLHLSNSTRHQPSIWASLNSCAKQLSSCVQ